MAMQPRQQLSRLLIPPNLNLQQPVAFSDNAPMFSPGLPTSLSQSMHPPFAFNVPNPLQTPMQPSFFSQPPGAPGRPPLHRSQPSVAHLAAAGIFPPAMPMTPLGQNGFPNPMLAGMQPFGQPFAPRNKRSGSISVGGPPKAVLGGPQRKVSPLPPAAATPPTAPATKTKKVVVNLPRETIEPEGEQAPARPPWARTPLRPSSLPEQVDVQPPEVATAESYPPDSWRYNLPNTVDVFLPGKAAWNSIKQRIIEEKLERLGVERGSGSSVPHIHAPHARAASISSPADPALLFFKLNKLQQSQAASSSNSLSTSPQPPLNLSTSPNQVPPRFQNRHGHSMSLAQPSSYQSQSPVYNPAAAFNPFGPSATLGSDQIFTRISNVPLPASVDNIHAPQGRTPANFASLAPPQPLSRPESGPDFMRGFGLDITEEEEEPEEGVLARVEVQEERAETEVGTDATQEDNEDLDQDGVSTVAQSRIHSRHVSRLSAALSLMSVGGTTEPLSATAVMPPTEVVPLRSPVGGVEVDDMDQDAVGEWTGSEDLPIVGETSEDESIGEWSNPSDEERARQQRLERRMLRRAKHVQQDLETPRRLPNFPPPPETLPQYVPGPKDDDIVSNPSEEGHDQDAYIYTEHGGHYSRPSSHLSGQGRPLPPLPNSRPGSAPYSYHDPALAHSREASEQYLQPGGLHPRPVQPLTSTSRGESLNPLAKPFVFGVNRQSDAWSSASAVQQLVTPVPLPNLGHARTPSLGKPLNAAAQEFKPMGFTFRPPPGVPQLTFEAPQQVPRPLPTPPASIPEVVRATQGREKRQRRLSSVTLDGEDEDGVNTMSSFKFPPSGETLRAVSAPVSPPASVLGKDTSMNAAAKPFTFSGFSNTLPSISQQKDTLAPVNDENQPLVQSPTADGTGAESAHELPFPPTMKSKRAPIPLDFKHPVSTNTVPAGLFKALVNADGDDRTRRAVRSRLSSRDIYEHSPRPSLDDLNVPPISQRISRNRLFTDPGLLESSPKHGDIFSPERPVRRSSLPPRHHGPDSSVSDISVPPVNLSRRIEMQQYEQRLEDLLDEKFEDMKQALQDFKQGSDGQTLDSSTEAMLSEVVSLFRAQLQESAARGLDDSQMDARGELDFEVIKGIIEQKQAETCALIQRDIAELAKTREQDPVLMRIAEDLTNRTVNAVVTATSQLALRLQAMENSRPSPISERDATVREFMNAIVPHLAALRPEPIDHEGLTAQLTQAVKPHISQLIDLASDKRETAGLIVDRLVPLMPSLLATTPDIDMELIVGRLTTEVRKIVAPLDAHEIKEQVSDLVVERLDSRLAVRDRAFNVDVLTEKVAESIRGILAPVHELQAAVEMLGRKEQVPVVSKLDLSSIRKEVSSLLSDLPERLAAATEALGGAQAEFKQKVDATAQNAPMAKSISQIEATVNGVAHDHEKLVAQNQEFSDFCQDIIKHINALPEAMVEATRILQNVHADFAARDTSQKDAEEIRRLMTTSAELQVQLAKARGAHGQVRVEKDMLAEQLKSTEVERDRLSSKVEELQLSASAKLAEATTTEAKNIELEEALARALDRLKAADVQVQSDHERISQLEALNRELGTQKQQLKSQVDSLDLRVAFITREKDNIAEDLALQRRQSEELISQQSHWDELRQASEQIQMLTKLVGQPDTEEIKELRRIRDRSKVLEGEHAVLQRRLKEYENKMANNEKVAQASRQSLSQAQQRAIEWERRAKDYESELRSTQTKLDQTEQAQAQLDADYSLVKLQLEERDAEERLDKDRQSKLRDQIASLEGQVVRLQAETDQAKKAAAIAAVAQPTARYQNGHIRPPRPDSRASTIYAESRTGTPTAQFNGSRGPSVRVATPPQPSVWDSIHAPAGHESPMRLPMTPKAKRPPSYYNRQIPSPTPSNVSAAPTLGNDGWWS
ncbi:hypothetical protein AcV7_000159 [Taiwanofungus camphoratus]|nr:hypothetical protein AcV7_000159 [Antrodia cinnamomea]